MKTCKLWRMDCDWRFGGCWSWRGDYLYGSDNAALAATTAGYVVGAAFYEAGRQVAIVGLVIWLNGSWKEKMQAAPGGKSAISGGTICAPSWWWW
jgi:hypothetical protein